MAFSISIFAQKNIAVEVSGVGNTKEDAIRQAKVNAIETAYGYYIKSKTTLNNDRLQDRILTVSSGVTDQYEVKNITIDSLGIFHVDINAIVSFPSMKDKGKTKGKVRVLCTGQGLTENMAVEHAIENGINREYLSYVSSLKRVHNDDLVYDDNIVSFNPDIRVSDYNIHTINKTKNGYEAKVEIELKKIPSSLKHFSKFIGNTQMSVGPNTGMFMTSYFDNYEKKEKNRSKKEQLIENIRSDNEPKIHRFLIETLCEISDKMFDYDISIGQSRDYSVPIVVTVKRNKNTRIISEFLWNTLRFSSHSVFDKVNEYSEVTYSAHKFDFSKGYSVYMYHSNAQRMGDAISFLLTSSIFAFKIKDSLGKEYSFDVDLKSNVKTLGRMFFVKSRNGYMNCPIKPYGGTEGLPSQVGLSRMNIFSNELKKSSNVSDKIFEINLKLKYTPEEYKLLNNNITLTQDNTVIVKNKQSLIKQFIVPKGYAIEKLKY